MLLSSLAEHIYWFGRYIERTETTARMILVNDSLLLDIPAQCDPGWAPVIQITGGSDMFYQHYEDASERNVIRYLISDCKNNPGAMRNSIEQARENLRTCRALFPKPVWEVINNLHGYVKENHSRALNRKQRYGFLRQVIDFCHLIAGKLAVSISHDDIYEFARMGFNLERADMTSRVIDVRAQGLLQVQDDELKPFEDIQWKSVLDSLAAWQMYRRCAHIRISGLEVLRFLLQDRHFPRSIGHCLFQLEQSMYALAVNEAPRKALLETQRQVRNANIREIAGDRLHDYIDQLQFQFMAIHDELSERYFEGRDIFPEPAPAKPSATFGIQAQRQAQHEESGNV